MLTTKMPNLSEREQHNRAYREAAAAVSEFARGWERTLRTTAEEKVRKGGCTCVPSVPNANELSHTNFDCPVAVLLRIARMVVGEGVERQGRGSRHA
jgi:hypothetical protein